jgi:hypothetical protein
MALLLAWVSSFAEGWPNWEDFQAYKNAKSAASEAVSVADHAAAVAKYKEAAELAANAGLREIQAWQLNNAGHILIEKFKALVVYQEKIDTLSTMEPSKGKIAFQQEIAGVFDQNLSLLEEAKTILEEAKALFPEQAAAQSDSTSAAQTAGAPMEKIGSNLGFVEWVIGFTKDNVSAQ